MSSILDIDLDYFNLVESPVQRLVKLLTWADCPVAFIVENHHKAFARWKDHVKSGMLAPPTLWRVKEEGIHLSRLIYLNKEEFKLLKDLRGDFLKRAGKFLRKEARRGFVAKKHALRRPTRRDLYQGNGNTCPDYEPTNIQFTRESSFWGWRRVKEYWREVERDANEKERWKEVYKLINS